MRGDAASVWGHRLLRQFAVGTVLLLAVLAFPPSIVAQSAEVTIGFQRVYSPWKVAIAEGRFEEATGYRINWKKFDSGAKVIEALAAGDVHVAMAGSSPISAGVSGGLAIELFWIASDIGSGEALVARDGSGIVAPQDLRGKRLAVPFGSTTHFHILFALEQFGIAPDEVELMDMQPPNIASAWTRDEIDAAFVWDPALGSIKESGHVLITSGVLSSWGRATFDGMVVLKEFAEMHPEFLCRFVEVIAEADREFRTNPDSYNPGTRNAINIASLVGGDDTDVRTVLDLYAFPSLREQASSRWLGGGLTGGAARALKFTSEFLFEQGRIDSLDADYASVVNDGYVNAALDGCE